MSDNEIINKLSEAADQITGGSVSHVGILADDFFAIYNLINRQKAEIEELRKGFTADADYFASEYDSKIKSEAIKEFAERLKAKFIHSGKSTKYGEFTWDDVTSYELDNLVKEMTEQSVFEEVYGKRTLTNGNTEWFGTVTGKHIYSPKEVDFNIPKTEQNDFKE